MTKNQLKRYKAMKKEILMIQEQILTVSADEFVWDVVTGSYGQPVTISGYGSNKIPALSRRKAKLIEECAEIERFVDDIDDCLLHMIISLRYINGLSWVQVALAVGGNNTPDSVRKASERFLRAAI